MEVETIDNKPTKPKWAGIPMSEEELKEYEKSFSDIEASIAYCIKHSCKANKSKV